MHADRLLHEKRFFSANVTGHTSQKHRGEHHFHGYRRNSRETPVADAFFAYAADDITATKMPMIDCAPTH